MDLAKKLTKNFGKYKINVSGGGLIQMVYGNGIVKNIGRLYYIGDQLFYRKSCNYKNHFFKATQSWGINHHIFSNLPVGTTILIKTPRKLLKFIKTKEYEPDYKHFNTQGYELQVFIKESEMERVT